ncbi:MAG TPA: putative porin [Steroidobacteraceae bacterium]
MIVKSSQTLTATVVTLLLVSPAGAQSTTAPSPTPTSPAPAAAAPTAPSAAISSAEQEQRNLNELRDTVINLLQGLVQKGVLTREQAEQMVRSAKEKAAAEAAVAQQQKVQQEKADQGAIRVPYVPQIVKDEISKQVGEQVAPEVAKQVVAEAKSEGWGIPGALPDWIKRVSISGDMRVRGEGDVFPRGNVVNSYPYLNWVAINNAGGFAKAGQTAFLNTSVDHYYLLGRMRLGFDIALDSGWIVGTRLTTGTLVNPDSTNQVLGQYGGRYQTNVDLAYLRWIGGNPVSSRNLLMLEGGKVPNPFLSSELVWDTDVTFEGVAGQYRLGLGRNGSVPHYLVATLGAFPVQDNALYPSLNKWMYAGQLAFDLRTQAGSRLQFGAAYYDFNHIVGRQNAFEPTETGGQPLDFTAPPYLQKGNTVFDIRNTSDQTQNLFALASEFHELEAMVEADYVFSPRYRLEFYADYVKNLGYNTKAVSARYGDSVAARNKGYQSELSFGSNLMNHTAAWRAFVGYRYLQRDAVIDAFTDQDYHLGGTDTKGYYIGSDFNFTRRTWMRVRYLSFDAIDGPPLAIDTWQVDINARF